MIRREMDDPDPDRRRIAKALMNKIEETMQAQEKAAPEPSARP